MADVFGDPITLTGVRDAQLLDPLSGIRFGDIANQELDTVLLSRQDEFLRSLETVDVSAARGAITEAGEEVLVIGNRTGTARELGDQIGLRNARQLLGGLNAAIDEATDLAVVEIQAGRDPYQRLNRLVLRGVGRLARSDIFQIIAAAEARLAAAAAATLPEIAVTAGRVAGGVPFALATAVVEGVLGIGSFLSDLALRNAVRRLGPPPTGGNPLVAPTAPQDAPRRPGPLPEVTVTQPRPGFGTLTDPFRFFQPTPTAFAAPLDIRVPGGDPFSQPVPTAAGAPSGNPRPGGFGSPSGNPSPSPSAFSEPPPRRDCDCSPGKDGGKKRKKKKQRKPREICYRGSYRETSKSLFKSPKEQIPCQPSR